MTNTITRASLRPFLAMLTVLALLAAPVAIAEEPMETSRIQGGEEVNVSTQEPTVLMRDDRLDRAVEITGDHLTVERVDDWREVLQAPTPTGTQQLASWNHRNETIDRYPNVSDVRLLTFTEPDATILVEPLGSDLQLTAEHEGTYDLEPVSDRLLEHSHHVSPNATESVQYYEHRAQDQLAMEFEGETRFHLEGSFQVYIWGVTAEVVGDQAETYTTGQWTEDQTEGTEIVTEEHFAFAQLRVLRGTLSMSADSPQELATFADTYQANLGDDAKAVFEEATGIMQGPGTAYRSNGDTLAAQDGLYRWSYGGDHVTSSIVESPAEVAGGEPVSASGEGSTLLWGLGAAFAIASIAAARKGLGPYVASIRAWIRQRRVERWMQTGDRLTSVRDYASAHDYYEKVTDAYPEISEAWYSRGIVLQELGRHAEAAEAFAQANESINEEEPELVEMAACEAWRAEEETRARELFEQLAILDPIRLRQRLQEPSFADLRTQSWMKDLLDVEQDNMVQYA